MDNHLIWFSGYEVGIILIVFAIRHVNQFYTNRLQKRLNYKYEEDIWKLREELLALRMETTNYKPPNYNDTDPFGDGGKRY